MFESAGVYIRSTRTPRGLLSREGLVLLAEHALGHDAPATVALRHPRTSEGLWGMHPRNQSGERTLALMLEELSNVGADIEMAAQSLPPDVGEAAVNTMGRIIHSEEAMKRIEEAKSYARQSPTAARIDALYTQMVRSDTSPLMILIFATELYATLATLEEQDAINRQSVQSV